MFPTTLILFAILLATASGLRWDSSSAIELVASLQRLYHARCIALVAADRASLAVGPKAVLAQKAMSELGVFSSLQGLRDLDWTRRCPANRPLNVVLDFDERTRTHLAELDKVSCYPRWVAFLDGDPIAALRGVNIQFNCVFLLAGAEETVTSETEAQDTGAQDTGAPDMEAQDTGAQDTGAQDMRPQELGAQDTKTQDTGAPETSTPEDRPILEVYRMERHGALQRRRFAEFSRARGLSKASQDFAVRRADLHGVTLRACVRNLPPLVTVLRSKGAAPRLGGFFGSVWSVLEKELNFTTEYALPDDGQTGIKLANGTWTGCIAMLLANQSDVAVCDFTMTTDRVQAAAFLFPALAARQRLYIVEPTAVNLSWDNFLAPFAPRLWLAVGSSVALLSLALFAAQRCTRRLGVQEADVDASQALVYMLGLACGQGHETTPRAASGRIVYQVGALSGIVVTAAYAAALISFLTVAVKEFPVNSFEELLHKRYKLGVRSPSGQLTLLETTLDPLLRKVYAQAVLPIAPTLPRTVDEGLARACAQHDFGFLTFPEALPSRLPCRLVAAPGMLVPIRYGMVTALGQPFHDILNTNMLKILHSGALRGVRLRFWPKTYPSDKQEAVEVSLPQSTPILAIVVAGVLAACLVLCLELLVHRSRSCVDGDPWGRFTRSTRRRVRAALAGTPVKRGKPKGQRLEHDYNE